MLDLQQHLVGLGPQLDLAAIDWTPMLTQITQTDRAHKGVEAGCELGKELILRAVARAKIGKVGFIEPHSVAEHRQEAIRVGPVLLQQRLNARTARPDVPRGLVQRSLSSVGSHVARTLVTALAV